MTELIFVVVMLFGAMAFGIEVGADKGQVEACKSVQLEWVRDKCMKVTREELK